MAIATNLSTIPTTTRRVTAVSPISLSNQPGHNPLTMRPSCTHSPGSPFSPASSD